MRRYVDNAAFSGNWACKSHWHASFNLIHASRWKIKCGHFSNTKLSNVKTTINLCLSWWFHWNTRHSFLVIVLLLLLLFVVPNIILFDWMPSNNRLLNDHSTFLSCFKRDTFCVCACRLIQWKCSMDVIARVARRATTVLFCFLGNFVHIIKHLKLEIKIYYRFGVVWFDDLMIVSSLVCFMFCLLFLFLSRYFTVCMRAVSPSFSLSKRVFI